MNIVVYEKPNCQACRMTKRWLDQHGLSYETDDIMEERNLEMVQSLGFKEAPVVVANDVSWSGFRPDKLQKLLD